MIINRKPILRHNNDTPSQTQEPEEPAITFRPLKDSDREDQPRERAMELGVKALRIHELFALILRTGQKGLPVTELCRSMVSDNGGSLRNMERLTREQWMQYPGVGETKAVQIEAVMELIRRYNIEEAAELPIGNSPDMLAKVIQPHIGNLDHEEIWAILLDRQLRVKKLLRLSSGGMASTVFDIKLLMKAVLLADVYALVLCHNHPSGMLRPSGPDDNITRMCKNACDTFDIRMIDHLIVTSGGYYSYNDAGRL